MSSEACPMAHLVEAKHDGRLGARENASLDRHLAACASCRALEHALGAVRERLRAPTGERVTPLEHQRGRLALLRAAAAPPPARRAPRAARVAFAAAAIAGLGLAATLLAGARPTATVPLAQRLPAVVFHGPERTETTIQGSAEARFERRTDGPMERVALAEGTLDLSVRKLAPGERFIVTTADAEVEVRGTVFEIEAHDGKLTGVTVSEGKVEVRHHGARALVAQGDSWRASPDASPTAVPNAPNAPPNAAPNAPPSSLNTPPLSAPNAAASAPSAPSSSLNAPPPSARNASPVARRSAAPRAAEGAPEDVVSKKFAAAVAKLASGDYGEASRELADFRKANPGDARAEDAAFLAIVSLQRAGKITDARDAARRYLAAYPSGDRRAEAEKAAR